MKSIKINKISPEFKDARKLIQDLDEYQEKLYPSESNHLDSIDVLLKKNVHFIGAFYGETLAGIGAVKIITWAYGEIKRVYVNPLFRGMNLAVKIMENLEGHLLNNQISIAKLETGIHQKEAIGLYKKLGYNKTGPFGEYGEDPLSVFMEKKLKKHL